MNCFLRTATIIAVWFLLSGCASAPKSAVDPNIAAVSAAGLRLGMTPAEVMDVSSRRLYKEDQQNQDRLADLAQKQKERATIRLNRVRSISSQGVFAFNSNAVTLTLQFARNRLVLLEERHTGLGQEALRNEMKALSPQFKFVTDRVDTDSASQWRYQGKKTDAHVRIDFRSVPTTPASPPMSSYTIVLSDPAWANEPQRLTRQ